LAGTKLIVSDLLSRPEGEINVIQGEEIRPEEIKPEELSTENIIAEQDKDPVISKVKQKLIRTQARKGYETSSKLQQYFSTKGSKLKDYVVHNDIVYYKPLLKKKESDPDMRLMVPDSLNRRTFSQAEDPIKNPHSLLLEESNF
jgi:hypothetical protein